MTNFILRWLYLSQMIRDVANIQTLPYQPHQNYYQQPSYHDPEVEWKDKALRDILSCPPGSQRLYVMDALRIELVQQLAHHLKRCDSTLRDYSQYCQSQPKSSETGGSEVEEDDGDLYLDADVEILKDFEEAILAKNEDEKSEGDETLIEAPSGGEESSEMVKQAKLVISDSDVNFVEDEESKIEKIVADEKIPSQNELEYCYGANTNFREYLPQLVSAVLKSPGSLQPSLIDPIKKLRRLLLTRCLQDPNWGIELCWLLEADVGRAWKTLFERKRETGKRLIVVLPAEKAAVLAKIGTEKHAAFDLLQDAEQATAYGYTAQGPGIDTSNIDKDLEPTPARLPSSLSVRRCSHFGDTMHFIDRLTQISLDLRRMPTLERHVSALIHVCMILPGTK